MHVVVTGATGFIGQALVRAMHRRGWRIRALVRHPSGLASQWLASLGVQLVEGDVGSPERLVPAMRGIDLLVHAAGVNEIGASPAVRERMREVNLRGTDHVLGAARLAGVRRSLYVSTAWVLGDSGRDEADETQPHDGWHRSAYERIACEAHAVALDWRERGLPLMIAMPNVVIGLNDHGLFGYYLRLYLMHAMPRFAWARDMALRPVEVETLAQGLCLAAEHGRPGASYHFGGPRQTVGEIFGHWSRHPGATAPRLWLPRSVVRCQLALAEPLLRRLGMPAFLSREAVECSQANLDYRSTRAERELGWQHADAASTWDRIVMAERLRMSRHHGWRDRLRHEALA